MNRAALRLLGRADPQRGSVMLEALVSIVVTSLAMLASAALAMNAAKVNQTGRYRAQAVLLVNDIGERISANPAAAADGDYALQATGDAPTTQEKSAAANCNTSSCTADQLAAADLIGWRDQVLTVLPQATTQVQFTNVSGTTPARYVITVNWVERSVGHGGATRTNAGQVGNSENFAYSATLALRPR